MPTHVVYIDDSGTKEYAASPELYKTRGCSRYFVFGAVVLTTAESGNLTTKIVDLKRHYFGTDQVEIKSTRLRYPEQQEKYYLAPFKITIDDLRAFISAYYDLICASDLQLIAAVVDKVHMQEKYPSPWYAPAAAYEVLMQRIVREVRQPNSFSVIIDDMTGANPKGNQHKRNLINHHEILKKRGSGLQRGLDFSSMTGDLKFVNSATSHQVQVADIIAYNVYRQFVDYGEAWETPKGPLPTYEWFGRIVSKFRCGADKRVQGFGIIKFPLLTQVKWRMSKES